MLNCAVCFKCLSNEVIATICLFISTNFSKQSGSWKVLDICELWALSTVVSENNATFLCELLLERCIYLRNTQKQQKITNYGPNKSLLELYVVYNSVWRVCVYFIELSGGDLILFS